MKELPINLERFKESLGLIVGRSNTKAIIQKEWEKKGLQASQKALDCTDKFLENAGVKALQEAYLKSLQGAMDRSTRGRFGVELNEVEVKEIARLLSKEKTRPQKMAQPLLASEDSHTVEEVLRLCGKLGKQRSRAI
jgi:hypothetical protein